RLGFKEARELADLPDRIAALEHEHAAIMQRLAEPALYRDAPGELKTLKARLRAVESELALKLERWEKLETLNSPARAPVK
ncbi:MAG TPA: ABC transporter C-terminal domain-containing protein, partial [Burkholderiales bacterium]|nr:ABC transporter C-terminal domain-containing protein [Burkholderiales bacterium]